MNNEPKMITLKTLKDASQQQIFDQVATHLMTQKRKSTRVDYCAYRGDDGLMCAAGCLIGDDEYVDGMDTSVDGVGTAWDNLINRGLVPSDHSQFIIRLQTIHDQTSPDTSWLYRLGEFADRNSLSKSVLDQFKQPLGNQVSWPV